MNAEECRKELMDWLKEAKDALHQLNTGGSVRVVVDQNGERVEYTAANRQSLLAYIMRLQSAINSNNPCGAMYGAPGKPVGFIF